MDFNGCTSCSFTMANRIRRKLPSRIQEACSRERDPDSAWNLSDLREALMVEITRLEDCETKYKSQINEGKKSHQGTSRSNTNSQHFRSSDGSAQKHQSTVGSFYVGASGCTFCAEDHLVYNCTKYDTSEERRARVSELRLCFKCLKSGHRSADCPEEAPYCRNCKATGHHGALCFKRNKGRQSEVRIASSNAKITTTPATSSPTNIPTSVATINAMATGCGKATALHTAMVSLKTRDRTKLVRALFDQGARRSFIKRGILRNEDTTCHHTTLTIDGFNTMGTETQYDVLMLLLKAQHMETSPWM
jgi:hypothetical protein